MPWSSGEDSIRQPATERSLRHSEGDSGPALDEKNPEQSLLLQAIRYEGHLNMPPTGKMKPGEIEAIVHWVKMGAPWPEDSANSSTPIQNKAAKTVEERRREHWAWQAPKRTYPPEVKNTAWVRSPIDRFILANWSRRI